MIQNIISICTSVMAERAGLRTANICFLCVVEQWLKAWHEDRERERERERKDKTYVSNEHKNIGSRVSLDNLDRRD